MKFPFVQIFRNLKKLTITILNISTMSNWIRQLFCVKIETYETRMRTLENYLWRGQFLPKGVMIRSAEGHRFHSERFVLGMERVRYTFSCVNEQIRIQFINVTEKNLTTVLLIVMIAEGDIFHVDGVVFTSNNSLKEMFHTLTRIDLAKADIWVETPSKAKTTCFYLITPEFYDRYFLEYYTAFEVWEVFSRIGAERFRFIDHVSNPWIKDANFQLVTFDTALQSPSTHWIYGKTEKTIIQVFKKRKVSIRYDKTQFVVILIVTAMQIEMMIDSLPLVIQIGNCYFDFPLNSDPYQWVYELRGLFFLTTEVSISSKKDRNFNSWKSYLIFPITSSKSDAFYLQREIERWRCSVLNNR